MKRFPLLLPMLMSIGGSFILIVTLFTTSDASATNTTTYNSVAYQQATSTLDIFLATSFPDNYDAQATAYAIIQNQIDSAVLATLIALTPSPTPLPTNVPVDLTFAEHSPRLGPDDAPITIVEFSDYQCPYCGRFHTNTLMPLLDHYGDLVQFIYREYPIIGGQSSADAGAAALCAGQQDSYWPFADLIWATTSERGALTGEVLTGFATQLELDMEVYTTCIESSEGLNMVIIDYQAGRDFAITGTPTFFINGEKVVGAQPIEVFISVIDRQLREKGIEPPEASS